jgi:hypothetical protein
VHAARGDTAGRLIGPSRQTHHRFQPAGPDQPGQRVAQRAVTDQVGPAAARAGGRVPQRAHRVPCRRAAARRSPPAATGVPTMARADRPSTGERPAAEPAVVQAGPRRPGTGSPGRAGPIRVARCRDACLRGSPATAWCRVACPHLAGSNRDGVRDNWRPPRPALCAGRRLARLDATSPATTWPLRRSRVRYSGSRPGPWARARCGRRWWWYERCHGLG